MARKGYAWVYSPKPTKLTKYEKEEILKKVTQYVEESTKLKEKVSRLDVKAGRIYLYELVEQFNPEGAIFIKPLIDGKYLEFPLGRITLYDSIGENCTADWQRHTGQWITLYEGNLEDCINLWNREVVLGFAKLKNYQDWRKM
jgi:hypothetical protein